MKIVELEDKVIYQSENGKKLRFIGQTEQYDEIVLKEKKDELVEEIENGDSN